MAYGFLDIASTPGVGPRRKPTAAANIGRVFTATAPSTASRKRSGVHRRARQLLYGDSLGERLALCAASRRPAGFIRILDEKTLAIPDFRGNRQYISTGNLAGNDRAALILMDYPNRRRLKIYAHVEAKDLAAEPELAAKLTLPGYKAKVERGLIIHLDAFDWNCPQHITPRFSEAELEPALAPFRARLEALEKENKVLRAELAASRQPAGKPRNGHAEGLKQKNGVQRQNDQRCEAGGDVRQAAARERPHDVFAAREYDERDDRCGQGDAQHHLAHDERVGRIHSKPDDDKCRNHGHQSAHDQQECGSRRSLA